VNYRIVECSSKVLASRIVCRYALSKGSAKGPQCLLQSFGWLFVLAVKVPAPKGRIKLVRGGLVLSNMAVKVLALLSSKVLAPGGRRQAQLRGRIIVESCVGGRGPNRPKVS
jgi:hypothetical protein